jgi:hypothetical protein
MCSGSPPPHAAPAQFALESGRGPSAPLEADPGGSPQCAWLLEEYLRLADGQGDHGVLRDSRAAVQPAAAGSVRRPGYGFAADAYGNLKTVEWISNPPHGTIRILLRRRFGPSNESSTYARGRIRLRLRSRLSGGSEPGPLCDWPNRSTFPRLGIEKEFLQVRREGRER